MEQENNWPLADKAQALFKEVRNAGGHALILIGDKDKYMCAVGGTFIDITATLREQMSNDESVAEVICTAARAHKIMGGLRNLGYDGTDISEFLKGFTPSEVEDILKDIPEN